MLVCHTILGLAGANDGSVRVADIRRRLQEVKAASRGRIDALLDYMTHNDLATVVSREPYVIAPSAALLENYRQVLEIATDALNRLAPANPRPKIDAAYCLRYWGASDRATDALAPFGEEFKSPMHGLWERNGGLMFFFNILQVLPDARPAGQGAISISALARGCEVSRIHVLKMLNDGRADELLTWDAERRMVGLTEKSLEHFETFFRGFSRPRSTTSRRSPNRTPFRHRRPVRTFSFLQLAPPPRLARFAPVRSTGGEATMKMRTSFVWAGASVGALMLLSGGAANAGSVGCADYLRAYHAWTNADGEYNIANNQLAIAERRLSNANATDKAPAASAVASWKHSVNQASKKLQAAKDQMTQIALAMQKDGHNASECPGLPKKHPHL